MCKRYFDYWCEPLYFLDYIATNKVVPEVIEQIVKGVSDGCEETNTALIGGETMKWVKCIMKVNMTLPDFCWSSRERRLY